MKSNNLTSFRDHLDKEYGKVGTKSRTEYEEGFEAFKLGENNFPKKTESAKNLLSKAGLPNEIKGVKE